MTRHLTRALASLLIYSTVALSAERTIDFSECAGLIRPLNGANGGPMCYRGLVDLSRFQSELGLPLIRMAVCGA